MLFNEAEKIKIQNQDFMNYILGLYIRIGTMSVLDNKVKYPAEPMLKNMNKSQSFDDDLFMAQLKSYAEIHNKNIRNKKKNTKESG
jgi:hypothetical protein